MQLKKLFTSVNKFHHGFCTPELDLVNQTSVIIIKETKKLYKEKMNI